MPTCFLQVTGPILSAKHSLIVDRVHELLQVLEHGIELVLSLLFAISVSLVDFVFQILLDRTCQAGIRLVNCSLYMHEPCETSLYIPCQNCGFV